MNKLLYFICSILFLFSFSTLSVHATSKTCLEILLSFTQANKAPANILLFSQKKSLYLEMIEKGEKISFPNTIEEQMALMESVWIKSAQAGNSHYNIDITSFDFQKFLIEKNKQTVQLEKYFQKIKAGKKDISTLVTDIYTLMLGDPFKLKTIITSDGKIRDYMTRIISEQIVKDGISNYVTQTTPSAGIGIWKKIIAFSEHSIGKSGITILLNLPALNFKIPVYLPEIKDANLAKEFLENLLLKGLDESYKMFKDRAGFELRYNSFKKYYMRLVPLIFLTTAAYQIQEELEKKSSKAKNEITQVLDSIKDEINNTPVIPLRERILQEMIKQFEKENGRLPTDEELNELKKAIKI